MKAYIKDGKVVAIMYGTEPFAPKDLETVDVTKVRPMPRIGWTYSSGKFAPPIVKNVVPDTTLDEIKTAAYKFIDQEAVLVRNQFIGEFDNQYNVYTAKYQDAKAWTLQVFGKDLSSYKWLSAEVSATGKTADGAAADIISKFGAMVDVLTKVEELRINAKADIRSSTDPKVIQEAKSLALSELNKLRG